MTGRPRLVALIGIAVLLALAALVLVAGRDEAHTDPEPADYNTQGRWPGTDPLVCVLDETHGFPVVQAAAEFGDLPVTFVVETDCTGYVNVVRIVTIINVEDGNAGWFRAERRSDGLYASATIWLNVGQAFRLDPHDWRMVLVHELGHAAGLAHTHEADSVMDPLDYAGQDGLTETDRGQIEQLYDTP